LFNVALTIKVIEGKNEKENTQIAKLKTTVNLGFRRSLNDVFADLRCHAALIGS
jgi:hypothetical protein